MPTYKTKIERNGRLLLPAAVRRQLGIQPGDEVLLQVEDGAVRITTTEAAVRQMQHDFRAKIPDGVSVVDELIAWRREQAARDDV